MGQRSCSCTMYVVSISQIDYVTMKSNLARVLWSSRAKDHFSNFIPPSQTLFGLLREFILPSMNCGRSEPMLQHDPHFTLGSVSYKLAFSDVQSSNDRSSVRVSLRNVIC